MSSPSEFLSSISLISIIDFGDENNTIDSVRQTIAWVERKISDLSGHPQSESADNLAVDVTNGLLSRSPSPSHSQNTPPQSLHDPINGLPPTIPSARQQLRPSHAEAPPPSTAIAPLQRDNTPSLHNASIATTAANPPSQQHPSYRRSQPASHAHASTYAQVSQQNNIANEYYQYLYHLKAAEVLHNRLYLQPLSHPQQHISNTRPSNHHPAATSVPTNRPQQPQSVLSTSDASGLVPGPASHSTGRPSTPPPQSSRQPLTSIQHSPPTPHVDRTKRQRSA